MSATRLTLLPLCAGLVVAWLAVPTVAAAQQERGMEVTRAVVATGIEDREPVGTGTQFDAGVGTLYFYTAVEGEFADQQLEHVWLRDGEEVARVPLTVRGPRWRTWSAKSVPADWTGAWTVRLLDASGAELRSVEFTVGDPGVSP